MPKAFKELTEREILAVAIGLEEEDSRTYGEFAQRLRDNYPATARMLEEMQAEETEHRDRLIDQFHARFGSYIPLIRRQDVKGFVSRPAWWMAESIGPDAVRRSIESMESETRRFYLMAQEKVSDASTRKLLGELADAEIKHTEAAGEMKKQYLTPEARTQEDEAHRRTIVLQYIQPGLAGLMDGSVSTLAPLFAAAFATHKSWDAFLVGLAASVGAGISMGFAEALSDDGALTGRGSPLIRGVICGLMTTAGGIGHTLPYMIADFRVATAVAIVVVCFELGAISWVRHRFMETPIFRAAVQVAVGGILVFLAGLFIGQQ